MLAANFDITLDRAADYSFVLTIENQAGSAVNLTDATFYADIREISSKKEVLDLTPVITGNLPLNGQVTIALTKAQTKTLKAGSGIYEWDIFMVRSEVATRLLYGSVTVRPQITNDTF